MFAKQLYLGLAIVSAAASAQAIAEAANPLHPSYYWQRAGSPSHKFRRKAVRR